MNPSTEWIDIIIVRVTKNGLKRAGKETDSARKCNQKRLSQYKSVRRKSRSQRIQLTWIFWRLLYDYVLVAQSMSVCLLLLRYLWFAREEGILSWTLLLPISWCGIITYYTLKSNKHHRREWTATSHEVILSLGGGSQSENDRIVRLSVLRCRQ